MTKREGLHRQLQSYRRCVSRAYTRFPRWHLVERNLYRPCTGAAVPRHNQKPVCESGDEESVSPSRQGLASRHFVIAVGAIVNASVSLSVSSVIIVGTVDPRAGLSTAEKNRWAKGFKSLLESLVKLLHPLGHEVKHTYLVLNESSVERKRRSDLYRSLLGFY